MQSKVDEPTGRIRLNSGQLEAICKRILAFCSHLSSSSSVTLREIHDWIIFLLFCDDGFEGHSFVFRLYDEFQLKSIESLPMLSSVDIVRCLFILFTELHWILRLWTGRNNIKIAPSMELCLRTRLTTSLNALQVSRSLDLKFKRNGRMARVYEHLKSQQV